MDFSERANMVVSLDQNGRVRAVENEARPRRSALKRLDLLGKKRELSAVGSERNRDKGEEVDPGSGELREEKACPAWSFTVVEKYSTLRTASAMRPRAPQYSP